MVHERRIEETGDEVELKVSGQVRLGNLVMYDAESESHWLQETGRSIEGEKEGFHLKQLQPAQWRNRVRWDEWRELHPETTVLSCEHCDRAGSR